jgi:hypothetical protein
VRRHKSRSKRLGNRLDVYAFFLAEVDIFVKGFLYFLSIIRYLSYFQWDRFEFFGYTSLEKEIRSGNI